MWKATGCFIISVRPSFCLSVCTEQIGSHYIDFHEIWYVRIFGNLLGKLKFSKSNKNNSYYIWKPKKTYVHLWYMVQFFLKWGFFWDKICKENQTTCFIFNDFSSENLASRQQRKANREDQRWQYNVVHVPCVLDKKCCRHTLRICNTYCFYKAKMVTRRCPSVTVYLYYLSCFSFRFVFLLCCYLLLDLLDFCVLKK